MSYRPNYPESWRPPLQRGDFWRPSTAQQPTVQSDFGTNRRGAETRVRSDAEDRLAGELPTFSTREDSWRPHRQRGHFSPRGRGHTQEKRDSVGQASFNHLPNSVRHVSTVSARAPPAAFVRSPPGLDPTVPVFQPVDVRQGPSTNPIVPALLRSTKPPTNTVSGDGNTSCNVPRNPPHRYPLRSRQSQTFPVGSCDDASNHPGQHSQIASQNTFDPPGPLEPQRVSHVDKQRKYQQVPPPPAPTATALYLAQARLPPTRRSAPKKLLVVLDLNGTLLVRPKRAQSRNITIRPGVHELLDYLLEHHVVMVYSSARPENVGAMVDALFSKERAKLLAAVWGRDKLGLSPAQYQEKVQVYKKLEKVWGDECIQATCLDGERWSQANTVLVDDNHLKALSQPHNLIQVPEFAKDMHLTKKARKRELAVVACIRAKLEELKWAHDVSRLILRWQIGKIEPPRGMKLAPVHESADQMISRQPSIVATCADNVSVDSDKGSEFDNAQTYLRREMETLTTDPGDMNEPAMSATEWKGFLR